MRAWSSGGWRQEGCVVIRVDSGCQACYLRNYFVVGLMQITEEQAGSGSQTGKVVLSGTAQNVHDDD